MQGTESLLYLVDEASNESCTDVVKSIVTYTPRTSTGAVGPVSGLEPASILDWRPSVPWQAVDGCRCDGSFVWTALVETRLPGLSAEDRAILSARIRSLRKTGQEAWVLTDDDTPGGALVLRVERPEHVS